MKILALILFGLFTTPCFAQNFGFIRVRIVDPEPKHPYPAQLKANGLAIGGPFRHDNSSAVEGAALSMGGFDGSASKSKRQFDSVDCDLQSAGELRI
jgi:hypothetical protein